MADDKENLEGLELVEDAPNPLMHEGGRPRVIGIPEETTIDQYTGELTHQGFDYIEKLFRNRPEARQPLPCEAPGTRHRGNAVSMMKIPGRDLHMPVCARHREMYLQESLNNPSTEEPTTRELYSGGRNYTHRPIQQDDLMNYRVARAKEKKLGEFRDEKLAQELGAPNLGSARKKPTHGPGFPLGKPQSTQQINTLLSLGKTSEEAQQIVANKLARRKKYQGMFSHSEWKAMLAAGMKAPEEDPIEQLMRQTNVSGGKDKVHLAHHALLHAAVQNPTTGDLEVDHADFFEKAEDLGLNAEEARNLIVPAIQRHKRMNKSMSFVPKNISGESDFSKIIKENEQRRLDEEVFKATGKKEVKEADSGEIESLMKPDIPAAGETKGKKDTGAQAD